MSTRSLLLGVLLLETALSAQQPARPNAPASGEAVRPEITAPQIPFQATDFLKVPLDRYVGEPIAIARNSKGHLYVFHRGGNDTTTLHGGKTSELWQFGPDGKFIRQIGKGVYGFLDAHAVKIDAQDNIWCVDEGSGMVMKFSPEGRVLLVLGRRREPWDDEQLESHHQGETKPGAAPGSVENFNRPTDVTWDLQGNIFVSDGYWNHRILKFSPEGDFIKDWGGRGTAPGQLNTPHGIAADAKGNVWVADRGNHRLQVFDSNGTFLKQIPTPFPQFVCITPGPRQYVFTSDLSSIYLFDVDGKALGRYGTYGHSLGKLGWPHSAACPSENELYIGEIRNWRVQKLTRAAK